MGAHDSVSLALEQYKILWGTINSEMRRFWTRFNVLLGVEVAAGVGVGTKYDELAKFPLMLGIILMAMAVWALMTCFIVHRASSIYTILIHGLIEIEKVWPDHFFTVRIVQGVAERRQMDDVERPRAMFYAGILALLFCVLWFLGTAYFCLVQAGRL